MAGARLDRTSRHQSEQKRLAVRQYDEDRPAIEIMPPNPPKFSLTQSIVQQRFTSSVSRNETSWEQMQRSCARRTNR